MSEFSFSDSAATNYDDLLVPIIFKPWAESFLAMRSDWQGKSVLDLAAGTGVVTSLLTERVGDQGHVYSMDLNPDMLAIARQNCEGADNVTFMVSSAESIDRPDDSIDILTCQQGFQFFPEKPAAATEIRRVVKPRGAVMLSTWCNIEECDGFHVICQALESIDEQDISNLMRIPFDFMPAEELQSIFEEAGFNEVAVKKVTKPLTMEGGVEQGIKTVYGTPIAPMLEALSSEKQSALKAKLAELYEALATDANTYGLLRSNVLTAQK